MLQRIKQINRTVLFGVAALGISFSAAAQEADFKGKTITVLVGSEVGGGTDDIRPA